MAEVDQRLGQIHDVLLHAAGDVPGVRADDADPHGPSRRPPPVRRAATPRHGRGQPGRVEVAREHPLQHVPVLRVRPDRALEDGGQLLRHRGYLLLPRSLAGHRNLLVDVGSPALALIPQCDRHQGGAGLHRQRSGAAHHPGLLAEELHLDAGAGDVPVGQQAHQQAGPQPLGEHAEPAHAAGRGQHLHAQALPERDELVVVDDGDFPPGVRGPGRGGGEITGDGGIERPEEPVLPGSFRVPVQGGQRDRDLGQRRLVPPLSSGPGSSGPGSSGPGSSGPGSSGSGSSGGSVAAPLANAMRSAAATPLRRSR